MFDGFRSATSLHRTYIEPVAGKEGRFQPGPPLVLTGFPGKFRTARQPRVQERSCLPDVCSVATGRACGQAPTCSCLLTCHVLPRCRLLQSSTILIPGDTVWRRCKTGRLAILNDAAAYFAALRESLLLATRQVYIIGWDIHSLTRLVGPSGQADDGYPEELGAFLKAL